MTSYLVIVESPGKIKKISSYLPNGYKVMASVGHIRDLEKKSLSIDVDDNFRPTYVINPDKKKVVSGLKDASKGKHILIASDEDREGEFIGASLFEVLKPKTYDRITFNEITKNAILAAIKSPKKINYDLVNAQQARRCLDRLVGYKISPILYNHFPGKSLGAGRVQSPIVRLLVDNENSIAKFFEEDNESHYESTGQFMCDDKLVECTLYDEDDDKFLIADNEDALKLMKSLIARKWKIGDIQKKDTNRYPSAPFITSTLQQAASTKLHFNVKKTMQVAQKLYEGGYITYMRTDCPILSQEAHKMIQNYVTENYGEQYYKHKQYTAKGKNAQEAHEAIRPTDFERLEVTSLDSDANKLYQLIWKKTVSSQMAPAVIEQTIIKILPDKHTYYMRGILNRLVFDGFLKVYRDEEDDEAFAVVDLENVKKVEPKEFLMKETIKHPPTRYNEASLVKELEKLGIGRPSTYANMISKIQEHGYVEVRNTEGKDKELWDIIYNGEKVKEKKRVVSLGKENKRLVPTQLGMEVTNFLMDNFPDIMDYQFTAKLEEELDEIADGKKVWHEVLKEFNDVLDNNTHKFKGVKRQVAVKKDDDIVGAYDETGNDIYYVTTKYGPALKTKIDDKDIFVSVKEKPSLDEAVKLIEEKTSKNIKTIDKYVIKNGQYGPYIQVKVGKKMEFFSIKDKDPEKLTLEDCKEICAKKVKAPPAPKAKPKAKPTRKVVKA